MFSILCLLGFAVLASAGSTPACVSKGIFQQVADGNAYRDLDVGSMTQKVRCYLGTSQDPLLRSRSLHCIR